MLKRVTEVRKEGNQFSLRVKRSLWKRPRALLQKTSWRGEDGRLMRKVGSEGIQYVLVL